MAEDQDEIVKTDQVIESIRAELEKASPTRRQRIMEAIALAALGSVPWVGGVLAAAATFKFDEHGVRGDKLRNQWLLEHHEKLRHLRATLEEMGTRFEGLGEEIDDRIESEDYLALVRKTFRQWDQADTQQKRTLLVQLITNAAGTRICISVLTFAGIHSAFVYSVITASVRLLARLHAANSVTTSRAYVVARAFIACFHPRIRVQDNP